MSEKTEALDEVREAISDEFNDLWRRNCRMYDFDTQDDYAPYGNTMAKTGESYVINDDCFRENFKTNFDVDGFIEILKASPWFRDAIESLAIAYADTEELSF